MILRQFRVQRGTLPWRRLLTAALAAAAIIVYWTQVADRGQRVAARVTGMATRTGNR